jgi:hypothetical protein
MVGNLTVARAPGHPLSLLARADQIIDVPRVSSEIRLRNLSLERPVVETTGTVSAAIYAPTQNPGHALNDSVGWHPLDVVRVASGTRVMHAANLYGVLLDASSV